MSKFKIFLYTSEIASYIGQNKWDYITPFERLWKRCDKECYEKLINNSKNNLDSINDQISSLDKQQQELESELASKKITKKKFNETIKKLNVEKENLSQQQTSLQQKLDSITLTQEQRIGKILGNENLNVLKASNIETNDKKEKIDSLINTMELNEKDKKLIKKETESFINKTHGTQKEESAIEIYEKKFKVKLDTSQTFYKVQVKSCESSNFDWYIGGKVDGLYIDKEDPSKSYVIEVKNRTKGFFSTLREYEKTQIQLYLHILDLQFAKLVEKYNDKIRITFIYRDDTYIQHILMYLTSFISNFENKFLNNFELKEKFVCMDEDSKKILLKKLYLNDINALVNQHILEQEEDNNQNCMIDDLD
jgi:hypothetical protein